MTNDKDLWTDPKTSKLWTVKQILGFEPSDFEETRSRMAEKGFWPLYEGKHIEQFLVDIKPIERWVNLEVVLSRYGRPPISSPKVVVRAIASNTNERTCIAAVIPEKSCFGHSLYGCITTVDPVVVVTILNSFSADYALRLRMSSNVSPVYLRTTATVVELHPSFLELSLSMPPGTMHVSQVAEFWPAIWELNRTVAEAYGLNPSDFEHILNSFPVFARKRPEFHAYLRERLAEWKAEAKATAKRVSQVPQMARPIPIGKEKKQSDGVLRFRQAAVLTYIAYQLDHSGFGRVGHDKLAYFAQEHLDVPLEFNFEREAAGPWDPDLHYKAEKLAVKKEWLVVDQPSGPNTPTSFKLGPKATEGIAAAEKFLGPNAKELRDLCASFKSTFGTAGLERWATIHKCYKDLEAKGQQVTDDMLVKEVIGWKGHRADYSEQAIRKAMIGMKKEGLLPRI